MGYEVKYYLSQEIHLTNGTYASNEVSSSSDAHDDLESAEELEEVLESQEQADGLDPSEPSQISNNLVQDDDADGSAESQILGDFEWVALIPGTHAY
jgi:hypothetical protein